MKTAILQTNSETARRRRRASTITRIEIGLPILKNETSFMSNSRRIVSRSGSAQVLPDAHLEVDFFSGSRARIRQQGRQWFEEFHASFCPAAEYEAVCPPASRQPERANWLRHVGVNRTTASPTGLLAGSQRGVAQNSGWTAKTMNGNKTTGPAEPGEKQAGFDVHTIS